MELNTIDNSTQLELKTATDYFGWITKKLINMKPVYQRPYTYHDEDKSYWGNVWQKSLISDFLSGGFIQPLHLLVRKNSKNFMFWIIDGGHRTRTLYNFFYKGLLKTPKGFELEWNGTTYEIGDMTWRQITAKHNELDSYLKELTIVVIKYTKSVAEGRRLFMKLNDLHSMNHMEKINPFEHALSNAVRNFGDVTLSPFAMFSEYNTKGALTHVNMKNIKRITDETVLWIAHFIQKGGTIEKYETPNWPELKMWYELVDESPKLQSEWNKGSVKYTHLENILTKLEDLVFESDRKKTEWKKTTLFKMAVLINHLMGDNWNGYDVDWKEFNKNVDEIMASLSKITHSPYARYTVIDNEVIETKEGVDGESYSIKKVFTGGTRVDDIEFWFYHMITSGKSFGITEKPKRSFNDSQKLEIYTGKCAKCGCDITLSESEADHRVSVKYEGETEIYNGDSLCKDCNRDKSSGVSLEDRLKTLDEYRKEGGVDEDTINKIMGLTV